MKQLVTSFVLPCIDYCNSLLVNLPASTTASLQRVQNDAAQIFFRHTSQSILIYILTTLGLCRTWSWSTGWKLHWLQIRYRIQSKLPFLCTVFSSPLSTVHLWFSQLQNWYGTVSFRDTRASVTHRPRTNLGRRAFSIASILFGTACLNLLG